MKICVITSLYKPYSKGGAEQVAENIANGLVGDGHEVIIITSKPYFVNHRIKQAIPEYGSVIPTERPKERVEGSLLAKYKYLLGKKNPSRLTLESEPHRSNDAPETTISGQSNLKVIRFFPWNLFWFGNIDKKSAWLRLPWHIIDTLNFYSYFKIKKILKSEKPDLVMTHNLKGIGYTVPVAIRHSGIKHIHTVHDVQLVEPSGLIYQENKKTRKQENKILKNFLTKIYFLMSRKLFGSPDIIISPSKWLLQFYEERGFFTKSKKEIIKNPISPEKIERSSHPGINKNENPDIKLLYIGQIEEHKGIIFLVNTVKKLNSKIKINLNIVGNGSKVKILTSLLKEVDNIKFHGYIKNETLNTFFIQTDFLIVPSLCYENAPNVIYESFSFGIPIIASNIGGVPELVKDGYNGYIFDAGDEANLADIISKAITEKNKWMQLRQNASTSIKEQGIEKYLNELLKL